jgi:hypothetical protein
MNRVARTASVGCVTLLSLVGCGISPSPAPVPVEGTSADLAAIAGEWSGRYWSDSTARHGTLIFRLRAGSDTAYGEIEMSFSPALYLYGEPAEAPLRRKPCTTLDVAVVRLAGDSVRGTLAPYWDPDCDCRTHTVFVGRLRDDSIAGTFSSRRESADLPLLRGHWFAVRE